MSEEMVRKIADGADMIVRGYAFTKADDFIRVFNLKSKTKHAADPYYSDRLRVFDS